MSDFDTIKNNINNAEDSELTAEQKTELLKLQDDLYVLAKQAKQSAETSNG